MQTVASVELIVGEDWVEPTDRADLGLSTLVQQVMALLADGVGKTAGRLFDVLCVRGPWRRVNATDFKNLLVALGAQGILGQDGRGELLLNEKGLVLANKRDFLVVFTTTVEFSLRHNGRELGTLPVSYPLAIGSTVAFGGRLWQVESVHGGGWIVDVVPHSLGLPPKFKGGIGNVHERVRQEMRRLYADSAPIPYLRGRSNDFVAEGREVFRQLGLGNRSLVDDGGTTLAALWTGDRQLVTLRRWIELRHPGLQPLPVQVGLMLQTDPDEARDIFLKLLGDVPSGLDLARDVIGKLQAKYDHLLPTSLLNQGHASRTFDVPGAVRAVEALLDRG